MKKHEGKIICITMTNLLLTILFMYLYLMAINIYTFAWYYHIGLIISFLISLAVLDMTILGLILLVQKGYGKIILINTILIVGLGGFGFLLNFICGLSSYPLKLTLLLCVFCAPIIACVIVIGIKLKKLSKKENENNDVIDNDSN